MGRTLTADGKRMPVSVKVSEAKFAAIEVARGHVPRALWLEALIDAALGWDGSQVAATPERAPVARTEPSQAASAVACAVPHVPSAEPCRHPSGSVRNGTCECGEEMYS